jgi:putative ABC transport system substrate-binding protein
MILGAPEAQSPTKVYRIGILDPGTPTANAGEARLREELKQLGYVAGHNLVIERRHTEKPEEFAALAAELVSRQVDLLVTGGTPATRAAQQATATIPIVFFLAGDPVESGLVTNYIQPGGNLTGFVYGTYPEKMLELLKEAVPGITRVACPYRRQCQRAGETARALGLAFDDPDQLGLQELSMQTSADLERFVATARQAGADALLVPDVAGNQRHLPWLGELATRSELPAVSFQRRFVEGGGLMSYGTKWEEGMVRMVTHIDKILRGTKPGDLPVERPLKFELVLNLKTAKALGVTFPPTLLLLADKVIQ